MKPQKYTAFQSGNAWGVCEGTAILYDAMFTEEAAKRLAELESGPKPPKDWHEAYAILQSKLSRSQIFVLEENPALPNPTVVPPQNLYLYRTTESDEDGDPIDFGMVKASSRKEAATFVTQRLTSLGWKDTPPFKLYPQQEPKTAGLFTTVGDISTHT